MSHYLNLTKFGIVVFVLISGVAGYAVSLPVGHTIDFSEPILLLLGLYFVSSGSFAINQAQEWKIDQKMNRTKERPVAMGLVAPWQAYLLGAFFVGFGVFLLYLLTPLTAALGLSTVLLYNVLYTMYWKRKWVFGAVPGAVPGAMPVVIGYSVHTANIFEPACLYLFLIMFLWQMPHFWCLAIRFKEDYQSGGIPVLPLAVGDERTIYHIGLYVFVYVGVALSSPWFLKANMMYLLIVAPLCLKVLFEFRKYMKNSTGKAWLPFFLWVNLSVIVFLAVPVIDRWLLYFI